MYLYNIGYYTEEGEKYIQLAHELKLTDDQLKKFVHLSIYRILNEIKDGKRKKYYILNIENLLYDITRIMIEIFDFKEVKYETSWDCFGWASILDKDRWTWQRDSNINELTSFLNNHGLYKETDFVVRNRKKR